jgi:hypothetical protein
LRAYAQRYTLTQSNQASIVFSASSNRRAIITRPVGWALRACPLAKHPFKLASLGLY